LSEDTSRGGGAAEADGYNAGYAEFLAERDLRDRGVVPPSLADWLENGGRAGVEPVEGRPEVAEDAVPAERTTEDLRLAAAAGSLVAAYRDHGHLAARIDPFESEPTGHPMLEPTTYGISSDDLERVPAQVADAGHLGETMADALASLRDVYCGRIGYELDHIDDPEQREWLLQRIEGRTYAHGLSDEEAVGVLEGLTRAEGFESFLHRAYLGKKRFSVEGVDMLVPMLDEIVRRAAANRVEEMVLGMAHRGRLNVLAHIVERPYRALIAEFEGEHAHGVSELVPEDGAGDVKYHLGAAGTLETEHGPVSIYLAPNPSHLEHVNPVVEGLARAARDLRRRGQRSRNGETLPTSGGEAENPVLPVLVHGDAAFMGQGVVAETLNLHALEGYETGGTVHLIANNQLGFTTPPEQGRSTRYASDLALGYRIPVVHVNADHPDACIAAARLALDFRQAFGKDILVDLVGYRRYGHNEGDEPAYTQPEMYRTIDEHPTVRAQWAEQLIERDVVTEEEVGELQDEVAEKLGEARELVGSGEIEGTTDRTTPGALRPGLTSLEGEELPGTGVGRDRLIDLHEQIHRWPEDFEPVEKLARQMKKRAATLEEDRPLDWAHGEALAFASLVTDDVAVRLTGEDTERGTFSQRHLTLHDVEGGSHTPLKHLEGAGAPFEAYNSPLSEVASLGFEYGYSTIATESLVLWEAQFGDFANVGQAIIDQFIVAGRSKWGQESRLTLLLPHAYEGQGPEHSSARLERFLQLGGRGNIRVAYPTTPAQYFHLLRLQAMRPARRPLVVMTPKSLLRHPGARSELDAFVEGSFRPVLFENDSGGGQHGAAEGDRAARRLLLCSGKVYYDLVGADGRDEAEETAILRLERLLPTPAPELRSAVDVFIDLEEIVWVQEEPANMGAWSHVRPLLRELTGASVDLRYVGRPEMASPAEGYAAHHEREQQRIVEEALAVS
jgi:2-oxoglutarate dehydrogenase E1 component